MRYLSYALLFWWLAACTGNATITREQSNNSGQPDTSGISPGSPSGPPIGPSPDTVPPGPVINLTVTQTLQGIRLSWVNPTDTDFSGVVVRRSTSAPPASASSGTLLYQGAAASTIDPVTSNGTTVHYSVFAYDIAANHAARVSQSLTITPQVFLIPSTGSSYADEFVYPVEYKGRLYFQGRNPAGKDQPYVFDGVTISDVAKGTSDHATGFSCPIVFNNVVLFNGQTSASVIKLYYFDGTEIRNLAAGASDLARGTYCNYADKSVIYNSKLYFGGFSAADVFKLYEFDGTSVRNVSSASDWVSGYQYPIVLNNRIYFAGSNPTRMMIYYFDGFIRPVTTGSDWNYFFFNPIAFGNTVIFEGRRNSPNMEERLYTIPGGTTTVLAPISGDYFADFSMGIVHNGTVYFRGATNTYLRKIYRFSGGAVGGVLSGTVNYAGDFQHPISLGGILYFRGETAVTSGPRPFSYDGVSIKDVPASSDYDDGFDYPVVYNNEIFFLGTKWGQGQSVYIWNGTQMSRINKGSSGYKPGGNCWPTQLRVYKGNLVFLGGNDSFTTCRLHAYNSL